jgi:hypothetical protein
LGVFLLLSLLFVPSFKFFPLFQEVALIDFLTGQAPSLFPAFTELPCYYEPVRPCYRLIGYFLPRNLGYLCIFTRFLFVRFQPAGFTAVLSIQVAWLIAGSPVPLFSLYKRLAFSIPYTVQPVAVYNR